MLRASCVGVLFGVGGVEGYVLCVEEGYVLCVEGYVCVWGGMFVCGGGGSCIWVVGH